MKPDRSLLRRVFGRDPSDEVQAELDHHIEERVRDYVAGGLTPAEARRAAFERMGDLERARAECTATVADVARSEERRQWLNVSWLDVKLGVRMLAKYPGLSLIAVTGMAVAIAIGAGSFAFISAMLDPTLPLEEGDRIVSLQNDRVDRGGQQRQAVHDLVMWQEELESVRDLGAFRESPRNLVLADGATDLVGIAEMTASGFRVARVSPVLGRTFTEADERAGSADVVVIGYEEWQRRFDGDPDIVGTSIRLGEVVHTVIGVMPDGFEFPYNERYWVPLRLSPNDYPMGGGPPINIFGRLADGVTLRQAQAELTVIGQRMAELFPDTHEHLRPRILPYALPLVDIDGPASQWLLYLIQLTISLLLVVVAVNVAVLVYARTATRAGEIAVRSALGASRIRVVAQLFVESLVVSTLASILGLVIAGAALDHVLTLIEQASTRIPFWFDFDLSADVITYTAGLAIAGGAIVGVLPALRATGRHVQSGLQQLSSRSSQLTLGRVWTALIVVQVAIAVAALPAAAFYSFEMTRYGSRDPGYATEQFIRGWLSLERPEVRGDEAYERALEVRYADRATELLRRLNAEPGVEATLVSTYPGTENATWIEVEDVAHRARVNYVGAGLFSMFDVPVLAGRPFLDADMREGSTAVVVDQTFVDSIARGANVIGRRIRWPDPRGAANQAADAGEWFEIVGVVPDFPAELGPAAFSDNAGKVYRPLVPGSVAQLVVRVRTGPAADFTGPLRGITADVDPALMLHELITQSESIRMTQEGLRATALGILLVTGSVLLLSAAGIYAMMSFTVARRRREIGIRSALGADPRRILSGVFTRAAAQLGIGAAIGLGLAVSLDLATGGWVMGGQAILLPIVVAIVMTVGLLAAFGPARRGLAVQPVEALREE